MLATEEIKLEKKLPKERHFKRLGDAAKYLNGRAFKPTEWEKEGLPIVRIQNLNDHNAEFNYSSQIFDDRFLLKNGDLVFAWSASLGAYIWNRGRAWLNQHIFKVVPNEGVDKMYLYYAITNVVAELYAKTHGSGMVHVTKGKFEETQIFLPLLPEQHRIVSKIEELFSELDNAIATLKTTRQQLQTYRQSVLKHAFEGHLTKTWREAKKFSYNKFNTKSKRIEPLNRVEISELTELPEKWEWIKIGQILDVFVGSTPSRKEKKYWEGKINWVSSGEVRNNYINTSKEKITELGLANSATKIHPPGTVLIAMIGEGKTRGQAAILNISAAHNQNTAAIRIDKDIYVSKILFYYFIYTYEKNRNAGSGNNQKALNKSIIENIPVPFCSIQELNQIVSEIETRLSESDYLLQTINQQLTHAESLRQSILQRAFNGEL